MVLGSCVLGAAQSTRPGAAAAPAHGRNAALSSGFVPSDLPSRPVAWHSLDFWSLLLVTRLVMGQGEKRKGKLHPTRSPRASHPSTAPTARALSLTPSFQSQGLGGSAWETGLCLQVIAPVAQGAAGTWCCPGALGAPCEGLRWPRCSRRLQQGCLHASILVLVGARGGGCRTALVPQPRWGGGLRGTVGREGRISGEEEEEDGVSLPMLTTNVLWAEDLFLQPSTADDILLRGKVCVRLCSASW